MKWAQTLETFSRFCEMNALANELNDVDCVFDFLNLVSGVGLSVVLRVLLRVLHAISISEVWGIFGLVPVAALLISVTPNVSTPPTYPSSLIIRSRGRPKKEVYSTRGNISSCLFKIAF